MLIIKLLNKPTVTREKINMSELRCTKNLCQLEILLIILY